MNGVKKIYNWFSSKSTIAALLFRVNATIIYCRRQVFGYGLFREYKRILANGGLSAIILYFIGTQSCEAVSYLYIVGMAALNALWIGALFVAVNVIVEWKTLKTLPSVAAEFMNKRKNQNIEETVPEATGN